MSYDEKLAARVRKVLSKRRDVREQPMFGGLCFMVNGAMCCGLTATDFMVRVGPDAFEDAIARPHARPMDFTGRPSKSMVYVRSAGLRGAALARWIGLGVRFVTSQPAKKKTTKRS